MCCLTWSAKLLISHKTKKKKRFKIDEFILKVPRRIKNSENNFNWKIRPKCLIYIVIESVCPFEYIFYVTINVTFFRTFNVDVEYIFFWYLFVYWLMLVVIIVYIYWSHGKKIQRKWNTTENYWQVILVCAMYCFWLFCSYCCTHCFLFFFAWFWNFGNWKKIGGKLCGMVTGAE